MSDTQTAIAATSAPETPGHEKRMVILRRPRDLAIADPREPIAGLDTVKELPEEQRTSPFWAVETLDDLDALINGGLALEAQLAQAIAFLSDKLGQVAARRHRLTAKFAHLVPAPEEGKAWKNTTGPFTMGTYRHQPVRAAQLKIDRKLLNACWCRSRTVTEPDESLIRAAVEAGKKLEGVTAIPQQPVSFTPPKQAAGLAQTVSEVAE